MSRVVVLGCGDLAWGEPAKSSTFGRRGSRGHLPEAIRPTPEGLRPSSADVPDAIRLADEVEMLSTSVPTRAIFGAAPKIAVETGNRTEGPILPPWPEIVAVQARWVTQTLGGAGVLVTPGDWQAPGKGRSLLEVWVGEGWSWAPLEVAIRGRYLPQNRIASSSGLWLRLTEEGGGVVCANGPEAARAVEVAPLALEAAVQSLGEREAAEWWREEEPQTGWYTRQRIHRGIVAALKEGRTRVELGGRASLFGFSNEEALKRWRGLVGVRILMFLELPAVPWWEWIAEPGFLESPVGMLHVGIRWRDRKTILLESEAIRQLANHLAYKGLPREEVDPAGLEEALNVGGGLPPLLLDPEISAEAISSPSAKRDLPDDIEQVPPPLPLTALAEYRPDQFSLDLLRDPERPRILIEGKRVTVENVRRSARDGVYKIVGSAVAHGSIVRIDYEPWQDTI